MTNISESVSIDDVIEKAIHRLPQAIWYSDEIPENAMVVLDAFVLQQKDLPGSMADTHLRLLLVSGDTTESWEMLKVHHERVYHKTQSSVPPLPSNTVMLGHVACHEESQVEYSYGVFRDVAEKIARKRKWVVADISTRKPTIRMSDKLDLPLYKAMADEKSGLGFAKIKKPWPVYEREPNGELILKTWALTPYVFFMIIVGLLFMMAFTAIFYETLPLWLVVVVDILLLLGTVLSYITENKIYLDQEHIFLRVDSVFLGLFHRNREKHTLSWEEVEDLQTMSTNNDSKSMEQLAVISDRKIVCLPMGDPQWVHQRITHWLKEHRMEIKSGS